MRPVTVSARSSDGGRAVIDAAVALLFVALSVLMTWPLARILRTAAADPGDPFISAWILDWDWYATFHRGVSLFQANTFSPALYPLAYSDNLYGIAILLFPFRALGMDPLAALNTGILAGFAFSGFAAYLLGRSITGSVAAGVVGGIFYAFVPFRFLHLGHIQYVWGGWLPMLLFGLFLYVRRPSWWRAAAFGAIYLMNGLTSVHALLFGTVAIALSMPLGRMISQESGREFWLPLVSATLAAMALLFIFLQPYQAVAALYGMKRGWDETLGYSATWRDWFVASSYNRLYGSLTNARQTDPELWLFPGGLALLFSSIALVLVRRDDLPMPAMRVPAEVSSRRWLVALDAAIVIFFIVTIVSAAMVRTIPLSIGGETLFNYRGGPVAPVLLVALVAVRLILRYPKAWTRRGSGSLRHSIIVGRFQPAICIALLWLALGVLGSFGLHGFFHQFLFQHIPGFRGVRVPARWAMVASVGLSMLVSCGVAVLLERIRRPIARGSIAVVLALAFLLELNAAPIRFWEGAPETPPVYRWLASHELHGSILELPIDQDGCETTYMFRATAHHQPIVNGVSGFAPPTLSRIERMAHETPIRASFLEELTRIGCRYLVVHVDLGGRTEATTAWMARELAAGRLRFVQRFDAGMGGDWLFTLDPSYTPPPNDVVADRGGLTRQAQLQMFLKGRLVCSDGTFGFMESPMPGAVPRPARFTGWALSPYGIREVSLLLNNGSVRLRTTLSEDRGLSRGFPCYPETRRPRFTAVFWQRPPGVRRQTDIQAEIIDGRGGVRRLAPRWITWR
jgi:hypothetical protein